MRYLMPNNVQSKDEDKHNLPINKLCNKNIIGNLDFLNIDLVNLLKTAGKFYRLGVTSNIEERNKLSNVSFFSSILTIFDNKFLTLDDTESVTYLKKFIEQIKEKISKTSFKFELKFKFPRNVLMDRIMIYDFNDGLIYQVLTQILNINVLILELDENTKKTRIYSLFSGHSLNPWKPIILLHKNKNYFEPIINEDKNYFSINDQFMKSILEKYYLDIKYFYGDYLDKEFSIIDDCTEFIEDLISKNIEKQDENNVQTEQKEEELIDENKLSETKNINCLESTGLLKKSSEISENESDSEDDNDNKNLDIKFYNKTTLRNMKKDEIMSLISKNKKMFVHFSKPQKLTKNELIEKFIFFQNLIKNQHSVQSSSS